MYKLAMGEKYEPLEKNKEKVETAAARRGRGRSKKAAFLMAGGKRSVKEERKSGFSLPQTAKTNFEKKFYANFFQLFTAQEPRNSFEKPEYINKFETIIAC